jgi:hypothetical protein
MRLLSVASGLRGFERAKIPSKLLIIQFKNNMMKTRESTLDLGADPSNLSISSHQWPDIVRAESSDTLYSSGASISNSEHVNIKKNEYPDTWKRRMPSKESIYRCCSHPLNIKFWLIVLTLLILAAIAATIAALVMVPPYVQRRFENFSGSSFPLLKFENFTDDSIYMGIESYLPFTNYFDTTIEFEDYMKFINVENGIVVSKLEFPTINFGYNRKYFLEQRLQFILTDSKEWVRLWKSWIIRALDKDVPASMQKPTKWLISFPVRVKMLGFTWKHIQINKYIEFSGHLTGGKGKSLLDMQLSDWALINSIRKPGLQITMTYSNNKEVYVNFGDFQFSAYTVYKKNETFSEPIRILDVMFPNFVIQPGTHDLTISNQLQLSEPSSLSSTMQILGNVLKKEASLIIFQDFRSYHNGRIVQWLDEILRFLQFLIKLEPNESIIKTIFGRNGDNIREKFKTTVNRIEDATTGRFKEDPEQTIPTATETEPNDGPVLNEETFSDIYDTIINQNSTNSYNTTSISSGMNDTRTE